MRNRVRFLVIFLMTISRSVFSQHLPLQIITVDDELAFDTSANIRYYDLSEALKNPDSVKSLVLQGQNLKTLPKTITKLKNLEELYLGYVQHVGFIETNKFTEIPVEIFELTKLKVLQLNFNQIKEIPEDIKKLENLQSLELFGNPIKKFPVELYQLSHLEHLNLGNTEIKRYPSDMYKLRNLKHLELSHSKSKKLSDCIGELKNLEWLDLSSSNFRQLPNSLGDCSKIAYLDLFGTNSINLKRAFEILKEIDSLKWIRLSGIKELPINITECRNLETLSIGIDKYEIDYAQLFVTISKIKTLKSLSIYHETGEDWIIPDEIGLCTNLERLELYNSGKNPRFTISEEIQKLTKLKEFSHIGQIYNYSKIKELLPPDCNQH